MLASQQPFYQDIVKDCTVTNVNFNVMQDWMASVYLTVPDVTIETKVGKKDKSKKGKKSNKQKKQTAEEV